MAEITIDAIKKLKELSGVGLTDAKKAAEKLCPRGCPMSPYCCMRRKRDYFSAV